MASNGNCPNREHPQRKKQASDTYNELYDLYIIPTRRRMKPSYNEAAMDDCNWHNSKATPDMILKELGMPHKAPIHYERKKINLQWPEHSQ